MKREAIVTVPAAEEWALVLRMAASGVGALYDLALDVMDDLGAAIDESLDLLLHQPLIPGWIEMRSFADEAGLHVGLTARDRAARTREKAADPEIAEAILNTLVIRAELERDAEGVYGVMMTLPRKE